MFRKQSDSLKEDPPLIFARSMKRRDDPEGTQRSNNADLEDVRQSQSIQNEALKQCDSKYGTLYNHSSIAYIEDEVQKNFQRANLEQSRGDTFDLI